MFGKLFKGKQADTSSTKAAARPVAKKRGDGTNQPRRGGKKRPGNGGGQDHSGAVSQQHRRSRGRSRRKPAAGEAAAVNEGRPDQANKPADSRAPAQSEARPWDLSQFDVPPVPGKSRFHDFGLPLEVMHAVADLGFEYCSPIQAQALPFALNGDDVVGKAQTGTGKTAAFLIAIIDDLLRHPLNGPRYAGEARALILAPTRELVLQIAQDAKDLCKYTELEIHTLVGGMDYGKQQRHLQDQLVDILVATPGRLLDFCGNKDVHLDQVEVLVIDEADRMLDMGFIPQIRRVVRQTPEKSHRQTLMFSATFTEDVTRLVDQWTDRHVKVEIEPESVAADRVEQHVYLAATDEKYTLLYNIGKQPEAESVIVFSNRRDECRRLHEKLKAHGFAVGLLSGEIPQQQRVRTLDAFKEGRIKVLVATDVAGRGIHIEGVSHVVNLTLPEEPEDYVHRIGRTGRAGKYGTSISFACEDDAFRLEPIQKLLGQPLRCVQPPEELLAPAPQVDLPARKPPARRSRQPRRRS